jgi:4-amino-4-deoxy-L-arabinose transferase-like glycosyltransferase
MSPQAGATPTTGRARALHRLRSVCERLRTVSEPWWAALAGLVFIGVTIWWLTQDNRVPDFDEGMHLFDAIVVRNQLASGQLTAPFTAFNNYPPLVHLVGGIAFLIDGIHEAAAILAQNFVFVPALVAGCYTAGSVAYGRRAGLLAALFALGTPMIVSEMREYYVDPGEAAMVAACVGAILASRRFQRVGIAALAGVLCALGSLTKETFVLFVGGLVVVVVLRGGWRHWRGLLVFVILGGGLGLPWYVQHLTQLNVLTQGATSGGVASGNATAGAGITPSRFSSSNAAWYLWDMLNHELLVPLTLFFLIGTVVALARFARHRDPDDLTPELVIGGLVGYLGISYITLKDPRYSLPALVYVAVLGSAWIATASPRVRRWLTGAFGVVVVANFVAVSFGFGPTLSITFPGAPNPSLAGARVITFYSPSGWLRGGPVRDGDLLGLIKGLKRLHFKHMAIDGGSANIPDFNQNGLGVLSIEAGLPEWPDALSGLEPRDAFLLRHFPVAGDPPPCQRLADGSGVYVEVGNPLASPFQGYQFVCPGRKHPYYRRTAPLPESMTHVITGPVRTTLLKLFRAMKRDGVSSAEFDPSMDTDYMDNIGLQALANMAGLSVPAVNAPSSLAPKQAYMLLHSPVQGDASPCVEMPGGYGLYMILGGNAVVPFDDYRFYCPLRTPHFYVRPG